MAKKVQKVKKIYMDFTFEELDELVKTIPEEMTGELADKLRLERARHLMLNREYNNTNEQSEAREYLEGFLASPEPVDEETAKHEKAEWRIGKDNSVPIALMDDGHLMNSIKLVRRNFVAKSVLQDNTGKKLSGKRYLKFMQYDALCYHAEKRGLIEKGSLTYGR